MILKDDTNINFELPNEISLKVLVTGNAGFIGSHLSEYLLKRGNTVIGVDEVNDYYDVNQKLYNLSIQEEMAKRLSNSNYTSSTTSSTTSSSSSSTTIKNGLNANYNRYRFYKVDICNINMKKKFFQVKNRMWFVIWLQEQV